MGIGTSNKFADIFVDYATGARPFLKWVGGKRQLIKELDNHLPSGIAQWKKFTYVEPFVGGGAFLFHILNKYNNIERAIVNDINPDLITAFKVIQNEKKFLTLQKILKALQNNYISKDSLNEKNAFFYSIRERFNILNKRGKDNVQRTALLMFLNKTCYNGLYRVNSSGAFNSPFGKYKYPTIYDKQNMLALHQCLGFVKVLNEDFETTAQFADNKSLFYLDPPYKPISQTASFTSYSKNGFSDANQIRLKKFCDFIDAKGCYFLLSNSDPKNKDKNNNFFDELYKDYNIKKVKARRSINSNGNGRGEIFELIIKNY